MTPTGMLEFNRRYPRINLELRADFSVTAPAEEGSKKGSVLIKTLGGGGVMFVSPEPLAEGTLVAVKLFFEHITIHFVAEVVWTELQLELHQKEFRCGLKFTSIADDDLLFIQHFLHTQLKSDPTSAA